MLQVQGAYVQYIFLEIVSIYVCTYSTLSKKIGEIYGKKLAAVVARTLL